MKEQTIGLVGGEWVEELQALIDDIPISVCSVDIEGNITYVNKGFEEISGYSREEVLGKNGFKPAMFSDQDLKCLTERVEERLNGESSHPLDVQFKCKDGKWIWVEIKARVAEKAGIPVAFQLVLRDITQRKEADEIYSTLVNSSQSGLYIVQDGKFLLVNSEFQKYTGLSQDELLGMDSLSFVHPEDREMVRENAVKMLKGQRSSLYEFRGITKDGEVGWIIGKVTPIQSRGERAVLGNYVDITEHKRVEEELRLERGKLQALMDGLARIEIGIDIVGVDYEILFQNQTLKERFGNLIGKLCYEEYMGLEKPCDFCPMIKAIKINKVESVELTGADGPVHWQSPG